MTSAASPNNASLLSSSGIAAFDTYGGSKLALSRHRRRNVHCAGMRVPQVRIVMAYIGMAFMIMDYTIMAHVAMAYIGMADTIMASTNVVNIVFQMWSI